MKTEKNAIGTLNKAYDSLAWMNLTAHLYNLTESVHDGRYGMEEAGLQKELNEIYGRLLSCIREYAESGKNVRAKLTEQMAGLREEVVKRSEQVQVLCDALQIYEYLFNRMEYSLQTYDTPFDNEEEARKLLGSIFSSEDPTETNLRIQMMLSQLPVRITKRRFLDLIKDSFSIYENSDVDALEGFRYRIISAASMQDMPEEKLFDEYTELLAALRECNTDAMDLQTVKEWEDRISDSATNLSADADYLLAVQDCINAFYTIVLLDGDCADEQTKIVMLPAAGAVTEYGMVALAGRNEALDEGQLGPAFTYMEGRLEQLSERVLKEEARIDAYCENIPDFRTDEEGQRVLLVKKLMSTSAFARLEEQKLVMVDKETLNRVTEETLVKLEEGMKDRSRTYNRSVMASVLKELPVFFNSRTEVMNYVLQSFGNCSSEGEKHGAVAMLSDLLGK